MVAMAAQYERGLRVAICLMASHSSGGKVSRTLIVAGKATEKAVRMPKTWYRGALKVRVVCSP